LIESLRRRDIGEDAAEVPEGPIVQVSDLQTMAGLLVQANKTDDVMLLPSSAALRKAQGHAETARARSRGATAPAAAADGVDASAAGGQDGDEDGAAGEDSLSEPVVFDGGDDEDVSVL